MSYYYDDKSKSKTIYQLFSELKTPVEVSITLDADMKTERGEEKKTLLQD